MADSIFSILSGGAKFDRSRFGKDISTFTHTPQTTDASVGQANPLRVQSAHKVKELSTASKKRKRQQVDTHDSGQLTANAVVPGTLSKLQSIYSLRRRLLFTRHLMGLPDMHPTPACTPCLRSTPHAMDAHTRRSRHSHLCKAERQQ